MKQIRQLLESAFKLKREDDYQRYAITEMYITYTDFKELIEYISEVKDD